MSVTHPKFKAAAVQASPVFLDLDKTVDKSLALIKEAASKGAALIAFPETFIPGYPWFIWLDSPAWGMQFVQRYHDNSLVYGSPQADRLAEAAKDNNIMVVMGHSEKQGGSLYMGQWIIGPDGRTIAMRRKLKPTHVERTVFGEGDGSDLSVFDTELGRVGALCCWEHLQPLSKYAMYAQNEQVHVAAWPSFSLYRGGAYALGPEVNNAATRIYAVEGGCFVIAPCAVVSKEMIDMLCGDDMKKRLLLQGGGFAHDLCAGRPIDACAPAGDRRRAGLCRYRSRHDLACESGRRPCRPLCAAGRDPAHPRQDAGRSRRRAASHRHGSDARQRRCASGRRSPSRGSLARQERQGGCGLMVTAASGG